MRSVVTTSKYTEAEHDLLDIIAAVLDDWSDVEYGRCCQIAEGVVDMLGINRLKVVHEDD